MDKGRIQEKIIAEQMTGCLGAGNYRDAAERLGYPYLQVLDWTSSAGDWSFLVSKDEYEWHLMYQENHFHNYQRAGFYYSIDDNIVFYGDAEAARQEAVDMFFMGGA